MVTAGQRVGSSRAAGVGIVAAAAFATAWGCVPHKVYNDDPDEYISPVVAEGPTDAPAHLAVIEFDDHGTLWKRDQLEDTIRLIREANGASEDGTLVVVYIHGWKNDADPDDPEGALARFRESVRRDAAKNPADRPFAANRVVGVFLGWRGDSSDVPLQEQLTFWDRRRTGERIASIHMRETLLRIMEATKEHPGSKCFVVGHSMGGMIIGQTMAPALTTLMLSGGAEGRRLPVDLVILQNPAMDALASWQFIDFLKRFDAKLELREAAGARTRASGPLIASITSEVDTATGRAYPTGRWLASLGKSYRTDHGPGEPSQREFATRAIGHVDHLTSHRAFVRDGEVVIEPIPGAFNDTPFWVIRVSREISSSHDDVRNPVFGRLIERLIGLNGVDRTGVETWMVVTEPGVGGDPSAPGGR